MTRVPPFDIDLRFVTNPDDLSDFREWQPEGRFIGCDIETTGLQPYGIHADTIRMVQFGDENQGWAIPYIGNEQPIQAALFRFQGRLVGHNSPFDEGFLIEADLKTGVKWADTYIMHHLLYPLDYHALKSASGQLYGREVRAGEGWLKKIMDDNGWTWATVPIDHPAYWGYAALDPVLTARMAIDLHPQAIDQFAEQYERELLVSRMMHDQARRGLPIDMAYVEQLQTKWAVEAKDIRQRLEKYTIENPASRLQVIAALENDGWEPDVWTDGGQPSVNRAVLEGMDHEVAELVLRWRRITKWSVTYLKPMIESGGRIHPLISSLRAATGRASVAEPPLHQLPSGPEVRSAVLTEDGMGMWAVDYTGQEMRLIAAFANDPALTDAVLNGENVHGRIAAELHGPDFTLPQYKWTKNGLYAWAYGAQDKRLAITTHAPAKAFKAAVGRAYPGIPHLMEDVMKKARERQNRDGMAWARTVGGRIVAVPKSKHYALTNYIMQGSGADLLKMSMVKMKKAGVGDTLSLTMHDEVLANLPLGLEGQDAAHTIAECMVTEFRGVPFDAEPMGPAPSWGGLVH